MSVVTAAASTAMRGRSFFSVALALALGACESGPSPSDAEVIGDGGAHDSGPSNAPPQLGELAPATGPVGLPFKVAAQCSDDGLPSPAALSYRWTVLDASGTCAIEDATTATPTITCEELGQVSLEVTCCERGPAAACQGFSDSGTLAVTIRTLLVLDRIAQLPGGPTSPGAYIISHNVSAAYSGPSIRVRRASDGGLRDIGFVDDRLDEATIETYCAGTDCFIATNYDKSLNDRHLIQLEPEAQPKIYDAASGLVRRGELPCASFSSEDGLDYQAWSRTDRLGTPPQPSLAAFYVAKYGALAPVERVIGSLGGNGVQAFSFGALPSGELAAGLSNYGFHVASTRRVFTPAQSISDAMAHYLAVLPKRAYVGSMTMRQNGVMLSAQSSGDLQLLQNDGSVTSVGGYHEARDKAFDGLLDGVIYFEGVPDGEALEILMGFGHDLVEQAEGDKPRPADLSKLHRYIVVAGQSNAVNLVIPKSDYAARYGDVLLKVATGGTGLASGNWLPGGAQYDQLADELRRLDPNVPVDIWWVLGENDASHPDDAAEYAHNMGVLDQRLQADTKRTFRWLDTFLHDDVQLGSVDVVNEQKAAFGATIPGRWRALDPTSRGSLMDIMHWDPALGEVMTNLAIETMNEEFPLVHSGQRDPH